MPPAPARLSSAETRSALRVEDAGVLRSPHLGLMGTELILPEELEEEGVGNGTFPPATVLFSVLRQKTPVKISDPFSDM